MPEPLPLAPLSPLPSGTYCPRHGLRLLPLDEARPLWDVHGGVALLLCSACCSVCYETPEAASVAVGR
jgi:hypothetical protein